MPTSASVSAAATGYEAGTLTVNLVQAGLRISGLPSTVTSTQASTPLVVVGGVTDLAGSTLTEYQPVRPGTTFVATVTNSNGSAAQLVSGGAGAQVHTVSIPAGFYYSPSGNAAGGIDFDPLAQGTTVVSATIPGLLTTGDAQVTITVTPGS